jgi:ribosomal-protein-alanine N-acetyltransferase
MASAPQAVAGARCFPSNFGSLVVDRSHLCLPLIVAPTARHGSLSLDVWSPADADEMGAFWARNRAFFEPTQRHRPEGHWTADGQRDRIARNSSDLAAGRLLPFLMWEDGSLVGELMLSDIAANGPAALGYGIDSARLRRGIASEAVHAVLQLAFGRLGQSAVETTTGQGNVGSQQVLIRNGFVLLGRAMSTAGDDGHERWRVVAP